MCVKIHMKTYLIGHERREGIRVYQFLRGPLTDAFGEEFYSALSVAAGIVR